MANLQVKNVPEALYRRIQAEAERQGRTIRDLVLDAVRDVVERQAFRRRLGKRDPVALRGSAAAALREARAERQTKLGA